jgi:hypothetical protein
MIEPKTFAAASPARRTCPRANSQVMAVIELFFPLRNLRMNEILHAISTGHSGNAVGATSL